MSRDALTLAASLAGVFLVVGGAVAFVEPSSRPVPFAGPAIWQGPSATSCGAAYASQAVTMSTYPGASDCRSTAFVVVPSHEGGNLSEEMAFYQAHRASFSAVLIDDFAPDSYAVYASLQKSVTTCAVLYAGAGQPDVTVGGCVVLAVYPSDQTTVKEITQAETGIHASRLYLLAYGAPSSAWPSPIPASYASAMALAANSTSGGLVVWH